MLPKAKMVTKKRLESMRKGRMWAYQGRTEKDSVTKTMVTKESLIHEDVPVRLSFHQASRSDDGQTSSAKSGMTLFTAPSIYLPPGCKLKVTQQDVDYELTNGKVKAYLTHNEYDVEEFIKYL